MCLSTIRDYDQMLAQEGRLGPERLTCLVDYDIDNAAGICSASISSAQVLAAVIEGPSRFDAAALLYRDQ